MMQKLRILNRGIFFFLGLNKLFQTRINWNEQWKTQLLVCYRNSFPFQKPQTTGNVSGERSHALLDNFSYFIISETFCFVKKPNDQ